MSSTDPSSFSSIITEINQRVLFAALDKLEGKKTIVWNDRLLMNRINSIVSLVQLKDHNVVRHTLISDPISSRFKQDTDYFLYIVPPSYTNSELVSCHLEHVPSKERERHRVLIVPEVHYAQRQNLVSQVPWIEDKLINLPLRWFPTDHANFVDMDLNGLPNTMLIYEDSNEMYKCACALRQLECQMDALPRIVYKGAWATRVVQILNSLRKDPPGERVIEGPSVDEIVLMDRWLDPVTPLLKQMTFSGLADEFFGIDHQKKIVLPTTEFYDEGSVPEKYLEKPRFDFYVHDNVYPELCDEFIGDVNKQIQRLQEEVEKEEAVIRAYAARAQLRDAVKRLQQFKVKQAAVPSYHRITEIFMRRLTEHQELNYRTCQDELMESKYGDKPVPFIENAILDTDSILPILRLIALQSQLCNGLNTKTVQHYRKLIVSSYGVGYLSWFIRLQMGGLIRSTDKSEKIEQTYLPIDFAAFRKRFRLFEQDSEKCQIARPYNGYVPLLIRIIEEGEQSDFKEWKALEPENVPKRRTVNSRMLFVIGGMTRVEMGIVNGSFPTFAQCCTTATVTGSSIIESFKP